MRHSDAAAVAGDIRVFSFGQKRLGAPRIKGKKSREQKNIKNNLHFYFFFIMIE